MFGKRIKALASDALAFSIGGFAVRLASFCMIPLYTHFLTTEDYAIADLVTLSVQLALPLLTLSISDGLLRFGIGEPEKRERVVGTAFMVSAVGTLASIVPCIVVGLLTSDWILSLFAFLFFVTQSMLTVFGSYFKCIGKTKEMATISAFSGIMTIVANVVAIAYLHLGLVGYWIGNVLGGVCGFCAYLACGGMRAFSCMGKWDRCCLKEMLRYSIPLIPNAVFWWVNSSMDRFLLTALSTLSFTGLYSAASRIPQILSTLGGYFFQAWNISIFKDFESHDSGKFIERGFGIISLLFFSIAAILVVLSEPLGRLLFSGEFYQAWTLVPLLVVGTEVSLLNQFLGSVFTAAKDTKIIFTTTAMGSIVNVVLCALFVILFGGLGAVVATLLSYLTVYAARAIKVRKSYKRIRLSHILPILQIASLTVASVLVMNDAVFVAIGLLIVVFLASLVRETRGMFNSEYF